LPQEATLVVESLQAFGYEHEPGRPLVVPQGYPEPVRISMSAGALHAIEKENDAGSLKHLDFEG